MSRYSKLFEILRRNPNETITPSLMKEMGLKLVHDTTKSWPDCWWSDDFYSEYFSLNINGDENILDIVEKIISLDIYSFEEEVAEERAGEGW